MKILAPEPEPRAVVVTLTRPPPPPPPPPAPVVAEPPPGPAQAAPAAVPSPAPPRPVPARAAPRPRPVRTPPPPDVPTLPANPAPVVAAMAVIGEAQLAGALKAGTGRGAGASAGGGGGSGGASGGSCDMVRRLQDALRADPEVHAAVAQAHRAMPASGRAILVWDGDWIQDPGQAGKGLAGVRQAIALEIAFAPRECRTQTMRGLAVIAFAEGSAAPKLALGEASWRWSDLLGAR